MKRVERLIAEVQRDISNSVIDQAAALDYMYRQAISDAAREAESWWELFNDPDIALRRAANPNQIATRIRGLADEEVAE